MMRRRRGPIFLLLALQVLLPGCTPSWKLRTASSPPLPLQWPYAPNQPKVTYLRALTGLTRSLTAGTALAAVAWGKEPQDINAFVLPVAVARARDGRLAVADLGRACVHLYVPATQSYRRLTGPKADPMRTPVAVAFDDGGRLFVSDSSGRVYAFGAEGAPLFTLRAAGSTPLQRPTGLAFSPSRKLLYVVDTLAHTIHAFDGKGELVLSFGGRGDGEGRFNFPTYLTWAAGDLYVADSLNFRIQVLDEDGRFLGAFGHHGDGSGDFAMPKGIAVDRDGVLYVSDSLFDVVQLFDRRGTFLLTLGGRGVDLGEFWMPAGIFIDESDELYVCDTYNHRIQVFRITERYAGTTR